MSGLSDPHQIELEAIDPSDQMRPSGDHSFLRPIINLDPADSKIETES